MLYLRAKGDCYTNLTKKTYRFLIVYCKPAITIDDIGFRCVTTCPRETL